MKKYLKMTFTALSAIALNFSCLATVHPSRHIHSGIRTYNNIHNLNLTPLSTEEQISRLKSVITASNVHLAEIILTGQLAKIGQRYYQTPRGGRFFAQMSDQQFEELQIFSLDDLRQSDHNASLGAKLEIFKLITAKFFEVTNNKEQVSKTTASKVYSNRNSFGVYELGELVDLLPSPDSKRTFARQFLNDAKQNNNINAYEFIFFSLETLSETNIFTNQPWLQSFIREYLEQMLSNTANLDYIPPLCFIEKAAPDLYNEKFPAILKKCITDDATDAIEILLPRSYRNKNIPLEDRRLSAEYLNLALEEGHGGDIISSNIALYTDTSSNIKDIARTLTSFTQEKRQEALKCIKDANSDLYHSLLEDLFQRLGN